jgi:hypothetical protein
LATQDGGKEPIADVITELFLNARTMPSEEEEPSAV